MQQREEMGEEEETLHRDGGREEKKEKKGQKGQKKIRQEAHASPDQVKITLYQRRFSYGQAGISRSQKFLHTGHCTGWRGSIDQDMVRAVRLPPYSYCGYFSAAFSPVLACDTPRTLSSTGR
jgi:hypothetical protein